MCRSFQTMLIFCLCLKEATRAALTTWSPYKTKFWYYRAKYQQTFRCTINTKLCRGYKRSSTY